MRKRKPKLTNADVQRLRAEAKTGITKVELARRFGVSVGTVYQNLRCAALQDVLVARHRVQTEIEETDEGCWLWTGAIESQGYGRVNAGPIRDYAHRIAYRIYLGPIPPGLIVDHVCHSRADWCRGGRSCRHRRCVRGDHLEAVPFKENVRRGRAGRYDRGPNCRRALHAMTEANTIFKVGADGKQVRTCRACKNAADRERRRRKRQGTGGDRTLPDRIAASLGAQSHDDESNER